VPVEFTANNLEQENIRYFSAQSMIDQASNITKHFGTYY